MFDWDLNKTHLLLPEKNTEINHNIKIKNQPNYKTNSLQNSYSQIK